VSGEVKYPGQANNLLKDPELCRMYLGIKHASDGTVQLSAELKIPSSEGSG
jgi:hypothetical protein